MVQLFVRRLQGGSVRLDVEPQRQTVAELKRDLQVLTLIPVDQQRLLFAGRDLNDSQSLSHYGLLNDGLVVFMALRLPGGKGGFGALLRGQGRDGKITTNFDACRDLTGRRLRHVNAEKKLDDWAAQGKERDLEKIALQHVKDLQKQEMMAQKDKEDTSKLQEQQRNTMDNVKSAVAVGLSSNSNKRLQGKRAGPSSSSKQFVKRIKYSFPGDDNDEEWCSSDSEPSHNDPEPSHQERDSTDSSGMLQKQEKQKYDGSTRNVRHGQKDGEFVENGIGHKAGQGVHLCDSIAS